MNAQERLTLALIALAEQGRTVPCHNDHRWTSDSPETRAAAAALCAGCPVLELCGQAADDMDERWHVYGGRDRTVTGRKVAA